MKLELKNYPAHLREMAAGFRKLADEHEGVDAERCNVYASLGAFAENEAIQIKILLEQEGICPVEDDWDN